jgi:hypothetical protein
VVLPQDGTSGASRIFRAQLRWVIKVLRGMAQWPGATLVYLRPYEIAVPLMYMTPGRDVLRRELARRLLTGAGQCRIDDRSL